jgi:thioredoxin reductase/NAD-dependent dihydropyrimidine dehydrogenase PreA subunit
VIAWRRLFAPKRPEPSYPVLPRLDATGRTSVPGVYAAGEVAGAPLVKNGINAGHDVVERLAGEIAAERARKSGGDDALDLVIVGAGAAGLAAAAAAKERGLSAIVLEANRLAETIQRMTKGKTIWAEPDGVATKGALWFDECTREELLEKWAAQVEELELDVRCREPVEDIRRRDGSLDVVTPKGTYRARRVILAVGKAGQPRQAGVPGEREHAARIAHRLADADAVRGEDVLIYGGGDVAVEAAVALCDANRVALVTVDPELTFASRRNVDAVQRRVRDGRIALHLGAHLVSIGERDATFATGGPDGPRATVPAGRIYEMIGAEPPLGFFRRVGIRLEHDWDARRLVIAVLVFLGVYAVYSIKSYGKGLVAWPWEHLIPPDAYDAGLGALFRVAFAPFRALFTDAAMRDISADRGYQQGFLYSALYSVLMIGFGWEALMRWRGMARRPAHQTWRYASLLAFQIGFFLIVNVVAVQALTTKYAWRAWGLYQPFPLFFNTFFWWNGGDPRAVTWFFVGTGLLATFGAIPWLSHRHGKRFCSWVCGCGGMAETLGDRWRHLSAKGERSRAWEFQGAVILAIAAIVAMVVVGLHGTNGSNAWWRVYAYLVDFWLVAVIPMAAYPFFGGKVWCRYWCPLAAWNGLLAKWFGKLQIASSDRCISCTQCSRHCQVGVDVMAFAKRGEAFDNANSACIQCGICIDVCPMDVLSFRQRDAT